MPPGGHPFPNLLPSAPTRAATVTGELFATLGVRPLFGRVILPDDCRPDAPDVIVISHGLWQRRFGGASTIVGESLHVNGRVRTIVGVMPPAFRLPLDYLAQQSADVWLPQAIDPANLGGWGSRSMDANLPVSDIRTMEAITGDALGAERLAVVSRVLREGVTLAAGGMAIGLAAASFFSRALESLLYGITPLDAMTFAAAPVLLTTTAIIAAVIPARRAASIDPVAALRGDVGS